MTQDRRDLWIKSQPLYFSSTFQRDKNVKGSFKII